MKTEEKRRGNEKSCSLGFRNSIKVEKTKNLLLLGKRPVSYAEYTVGLNSDLTINALKFHAATDGLI